MDTRTDPGQYYPGGRVMVRPDVAPPQVEVNVSWNDIKNKPDFSDIAELGAADSLGTVKQTMNTVVNKFKTSLLIGALLAAGAALADVAPLYTTPNAMPGDALLMTNTQEYVDAKVDSIPAPDFTVSNDTLVATIEAKAPAPGNYEVVSNAAMSAVRSLAPATNYTDSVAAGKASTNDVQLTPVYDYSNNWNFSPVSKYQGQDLSLYYDSGYIGTGAWLLMGGEYGILGVNMSAGPDATTMTFEADVAWPGNVDLTATRIPERLSGYRLGNQQGKELAAASSIVLKPVTEETDTWTFSPVSTYDGKPLIIEYTGYAWALYCDTGDGLQQIGEKGGSASATTVIYKAYGDWNGYVDLTATRLVVVGFVLGDQTNKVLAATNGLARTSELAAVRAVADAAATTNAQQGVLLSAIVDDVAQNSADIATVGAQVNAIGAHLNTEDAHFVSTNYDSAVRMPEAYVEIKMHDQATGSNTWITIWQEMRRWTAFVGDAFDWNTWSGFHAWATNITAELSFKADRCWGIYDSETGGYSPEGYTQISSSNILIAAGMAYQRTVTSAGSVWVLQCNQGVAHLGGDTNGFFRVTDGDGVVQFEIVKGDKQEVGCDADGLTLSGGSILIPYSIDASEHPKLYCGDDLYTWKAEDDPDCLCTVSWSGSSGAWVATATPKTPQRKMFFKGTYMNGGDTYIKNNAPVGMDRIILNGVKYYLGTATISGHTVLTLSTTAP